MEGEVVCGSAARLQDGLPPQAFELEVLLKVPDGKELVREVEGLAKIQRLCGQAAKGR